MQLSTYSGAAVNGSLASNTGLFPTIQFGGVSQTGLAQVTVRMTTQHATMQVGMDGGVVPSWVPGEQGEIDIDVWQTSTTHQQFVAAYDAVLAAALNGNVAPTFSGTIVIQDSVTGAQHTCTGVAFQKIPDKTYQEQAQRVHWVFSATNIITE